MSYWKKEVRVLMGKAIHRYGLIQEGDRILVGVSGGKDSLTLLKLLHERRKRVPVHYDLIAVYIDLGFYSGQSETLKNYFEDIGIPFHIELTDIGKRANSIENRENPCFLCSWERRKRLFHLAHRFKCNKISLGHHQDDIIETFLLNIFYSAEISTMLPLQTLFKGKITLIRPLALLEENKIERFAKELKMPILESRCPVSGKTKRKEMKELIQWVSRKDKRIKGNIFRALSNVKMDYMLMKKDIHP